MIGIYKITNKLNGHSYVGQSIHIQDRWQQHISLSKNTDNDAPLYRAFRKYGSDNFSFEVLEECEESALNEREIYWVDKLDTYKNGYNATMGGGGTRKHDSQLVLNEYEQTHNMHQTAKNLNMSYYTVRDILHSYDIYGPQEIKPVEKIDPTTLRVLKIYDSLEDAAASVGCYSTAISNAAKGKTNNCAGFFWRFVGDTTKQFEPLGKKWKRGVLQLDKDTGDIIEEYLSLSDAAYALGLSPNAASPNIQGVCNGKRKTAYGYKWAYSDEE